MWRVCSCVVLTVFIFCSCGPSKKGLFADRRTDHEKYGDRIREAGLDKTALGQLWFDAAKKGLTQPLNISLPYRETGFFSEEKPSSAGYIFTARRGDRLRVDISVTPDTIRHFFAELWKQGNTPDQAEHIASIDSTRKLIHDVEADGSFLIRLQAPLLEAAEFTVTINTGPSLAFPVSESGNPRLISFWSAPRDGGRRKHEGVDISAKFRTPVVASADGVVTRVMENRLGGKVVFMRPQGKNYSLYYAHLDSQTTVSGAQVKTGDVLGLVGNTGNAKGTIPHLHFGIYTFGGAIDPLAFIDPHRKSPPQITAPVADIGKWLRTTNNTRLTGSIGAMTDSTLMLEKGTVVRVLGAYDNSFRVSLPDGTEGYVRSDNTTSRVAKTATVDSAVKLLNYPDGAAAAVGMIPEKGSYEIIGEYEDFTLVRSGNLLGWLR